MIHQRGVPRRTAVKKGLALLAACGVTWRGQGLAARCGTVSHLHHQHAR
jgi:hypothetical protein